MIQLTHGDILKADAEALVNTVNCVGVMGRGIALQFRKAFPQNFKLYKAACDRQELEPGRLLLYDLGRLVNPRYIINFPTKRHWKGRSRLEDIEAGLAALVQELASRGISSVAIPPLGCGLGGLDWNEVRPKIEDALSTIPDVEALLFEPKGAPEPKVMARDLAPPQMTRGRAALLALVRRYLAAVMDPAISLLEIHKLMYFMQEAGESLRLRYQKAPYGPYADNLRHVLSKIEGHFVTGYGDGADRPDKQIEVLPSAWPKAEQFLDRHRDTQERCSRVAELISGFETPFGMELLATVHWVAQHEAAASVDAAISATHSWNARKSMFSDRQIRTAWTVLTQQGWLA